jgi:hypothetical protein
MRPAELPENEFAAVRRFVEAVRRLSADPRPENVERYLVASRALDGFHESGKPRASRAA